MRSQSPLRLPRLGSLYRIPLLHQQIPFHHHLLKPHTHTSPTPTPPRAFYYRNTTRMAMRTQHALSLDLSAKTECDESKDEGTDSESEEAESEDQQQQAVQAEDIVEDEPLGLRYRATRRRALELVKGTVPSTYEVGQSSRSTPGQQIAYETPIQSHTRLPVRTTWEDPEDGTVYMDIECDMPPVRSSVQTPSLPVQTPSLPVHTLALSDWFPESPPTSLIVPSPVVSQVLIAATDKDDFLEVRAQLKLHRSILYDHTERLDVLPPTLFEGYGWDFTELFASLGSVREEIHS
ncbi:hypothetical protein Tco_0626846 [Tanacetum coccineum]|uniref:Uncharacterized protein n=1 Tax=Tanacetum coccineum TaxID=301880 RepID=A0ABQ4WKR2_9ASTR